SAPCLYASMAQRIDIKPELLQWAVDRSGKPKEEYRERVTDWLSGDVKPTLRQLEAFARRAMVPLGYLFLDTPPSEELPAPDYRTRTDDGGTEAQP
ncbi:MAG: DNA-binding protein, partial [Planctomycetota bacterium]